MFFRFRVGEGDASARCLCRSLGLFGKRRKGVPMLGGRQRVDVNRVPPERRKMDDVAQQRRIVGSPLSLCGHSALSGGSHVRTRRARTPLEVAFFAFTPSPMWRKRLCFI